MYPKIQLHLPVIGEEILFPTALFHHYLGQTECFEYTLSHEMVIDFCIDRSCFFMYALQHDNSFRLCYHPGGKHQHTLPAGKNKLMLITFRHDWLMYKCERLPLLKSFVTSCMEDPQQHRILPSVGMAKMLFKAHDKMNANFAQSEGDEESYAFINGCINKYHNRLVSKNNTKVYHKEKACTIENFVKEHYATSLVDDLPKLALKFMLSERNLARIAKMAFGVPLHEQVIKLRINAGLQELLATEKPVYEVARQVGYSDPFYFSKVFKKRFGVSPKGVKKSHQNVVEYEMCG